MRTIECPNCGEGVELITQKSDTEYKCRNCGTEWDASRRWTGNAIDVGRASPSIADIASPDAPTVTNEKGGKQSHIPVRFDLIDAKALFEMAKVLHTGAEKYGEDNWRLIDTREHINHLLNHAYAWLAGDETDDHLSHILCRATFALGVELQDGPQNPLPAFMDTKGPDFPDNPITGQRHWIVPGHTPYIWTGQSWTEVSTNV